MDHQAGGLSRVEFAVKYEDTEFDERYRCDVKKSCRHIRFKHWCKVVGRNIECCVSSANTETE